MQAKVIHRALQFKRASGTSRGVLQSKDSWFLQLTAANGSSGLGECSTIPKLSPDLENDIEEGLQHLVDHINAGKKIELDDKLFQGRPALKFCYETACLDLNNGGHKKLYASDFLTGRGIPINGLVWMGSKSYMYDQINALLARGFNCIKLKIAAIDFNEELELLKYVRSQFSASDVEIRVDANGGFDKHTALEKMKRLSEFQLHSIEQPIRQGQYESMAELCASSPLDIALDEELIAVDGLEEKTRLLEIIDPPYIILKPSLLGGFTASEEWIKLADAAKVCWWITSALEANIGLNAIAQWTASLNSSRHQGLGTGQLFTNNIASPLYIEEGQLYYGKENWEQLVF